MPQQIERYILLDRDGVINEAIRDGYALSPGAIHLIPGAAEAIAKLNSAGYGVIVVSNQQCVGKGLLSLAGLDAISENLRDQVRARSGGDIQQFFYCTHIAADNCDCRKPKPGLLLQAQEYYGFDLASTLFVGDSYSDIETACNAGCPSIFVTSGLDAWRYKNGDPFAAPPVIIASNLIEAVNWLLNPKL